MNVSPVALTVHDDGVVLVAAFEPPREARPGVEPRDLAPRHRDRLHRGEQLALEHLAERSCGLGGEVPVGEGDDAPPCEDVRDVFAQLARRDLVERREQRAGGPFRREQQLADFAHRAPVRRALVQVSEQSRIFLPLRLESRRGDGRRAQGRHDPREHLALLVAPAREADRDPAVVPVEEVRVPGDRGRG